MPLEQDDLRVVDEFTMRSAYAVRLLTVDGDSDKIYVVMSNPKGDRGDADLLLVLARVVEGEGAIVTQVHQLDWFQFGITLLNPTPMGLKRLTRVLDAYLAESS